MRKTLTVKGGGGTGTGVVTSSPAGINCTITAGVAAATGCIAKFNQGVVVTLTPSTQLGHAFKAWYNACTGSGACQVTMSVNRTVAARFIKGSFTIKIASGTTGAGSGRVTSQAGLTPVHRLRDHQRHAGRHRLFGQVSRLHGRHPHGHARGWLRLLRLGQPVLRHGHLLPHRRPGPNHPRHLRSFGPELVRDRGTLGGR